jgi:hypothetical protein
LVLITSGLALLFGNLGSTGPLGWPWGFGSIGLIPFLSKSEFRFVQFLGDVDLFYKEMRWRTWREDVRLLRGDQGFMVYPFLFTEESSIEDRERGPVPMTELWHLYAVELPRQLGL